MFSLLFIVLLEAVKTPYAIATYLDSKGTGFPSWNHCVRNTFNSTPSICPLEIYLLFQIIIGHHQWQPIHHVDILFVASKAQFWILACFVLPICRPLVGRSFKTIPTQQILWGIYLGVGADSRSSKGEGCVEGLTSPWWTKGGLESWDTVMRSERTVCYFVSFQMLEQEEKGKELKDTVLPIR